MLRPMTVPPPAKTIPLAAVLAAILAAVTACAAHPWYVPDEGSEAFRDGYRDGCRTGALARSAGAGWTQRKAKKRYRQEQDYQRGWDEGRVYCEENPVISPFTSGGGGEASAGGSMSGGSMGGSVK